MLESYGFVAIRITSGGNAVFQSPSVGSLSTPAPPDHFGICADGFHRENGPEHVVVTHDEPSQTVRIFMGLEGDPLRLCFEAVYSGSYNVDTGPLGICNHPDPDHVFRGNYYQFAYYSRTLTYQVDGNRNVISGEIHDNHLAGSAAELPVLPEPDAGVPDAAPSSLDASSDGGASPNDDGAMGGCACASGSPSSRGTFPIGLPLTLLLGVLGALARRRRLR